MSHIRCRQESAMHVVEVVGVLGYGCGAQNHDSAFCWEWECCVVLAAILVFACFYC